MKWRKTSVFFPFILLLLGQNVGAQNATRDGKQVSGGIFSVISFPNLACEATNKLNGTCMTVSECNTANGEVLGSCAKGFGACCFIRMTSCGGDVRHNRTYLQNTNYPSSIEAESSSDRYCTYRFYRQSSDTCNVRLDFTEFNIGPPTRDGNTNWECVEGLTDYSKIRHADEIQRSGIALCGFNTGHHVYIDMGTVNSSPGYGELEIRLDTSSWTTFKRTWNILASFIDCGTPSTPPKGCDRYYYGNYGTGVVEAYNYNQPIKEYAARLNGYHTVCIRREKRMCQISYVPPDIDSDIEGFTVNGDPDSLFKGRNACNHPENPASCAAYVRIPQGSNTGITPFNFPPAGRCDRFCGRRLCFSHQGCDRSDHQVVTSRIIPFHLNIEMRPHSPITFENRGYKLNYQQSQC
jgi:hypothetical protein